MHHTALLLRRTGRTAALEGNPFTGYLGSIDPPLPADPVTLRWRRARFRRPLSPDDLARISLYDLLIAALKSGGN